MGFNLHAKVEGGSSGPAAPAIPGCPVATPAGSIISGRYGHRSAPANFTVAHGTAFTSAEVAALTNGDTATQVGAGMTGTGNVSYILLEFDVACTLQTIEFLPPAVGFGQTPSNASTGYNSLWGSNDGTTFVALTSTAVGSAASLKYTLDPVANGCTDYKWLRKGINLNSGGTEQFRISEIVFT